MDFFKNIILKKDYLGNKNLITNKNSLHIAFGIDANFTIGTGVLIYSILQHNTANMVFHIFTDNIYNTDIKRFHTLCKKYNHISIVIYYINPQNFYNLPHSFIWSQATYYRFLLKKELFPSAKNILYLDSDILCLNNFKSLFASNFKDNIAMVVPDFPIMLSYAKKSLDFEGTSYFNAGVMFINLENWQKYNIADEAINLSLKNNFKYYDQDVLNILLTNKTKLIDKKYNTIYHLADMKNNISPDTIFLHYSGSVKPWQLWGQYHFLTPLWLKYKNASPWQDVPISQPKTYKQAKFMARMAKRNHKTQESLFWYLRYSLWKIKSKL